ncbi:MAG: DUF222 domain-containing protein [bacterium]|nr:DUF222 domain-containing protein [bacterium]
MEFRDSLQTKNLDDCTQTSGEPVSDAAGFGFPDFVGCGAGDLVMLAVRANAFRQQVESYLSAVLVRLGELEGEDAVMSVCKQFDLPAYKARRQARTAKGLRALPDVMRAAKDGWITMDHAELMAASHGRAPMSADEQLDLLAIGVQQGPDEFKIVLAEYETKRLAVSGLNPTEQQRARRTAKIFNGYNDMVVLHAELDHVAGERVKTAMDALATRMLKKDFQTGVERSFEQRNADALVQLITNHTRPTKSNPTTNTGCTDADTNTGCVDTSCEPGPEPTPQATTIILTADYDAITGQLTTAGLIDGTPIGIDEIRRLACEAEIIPMIFNSQAQPLYMGRTRRKHTKAQKLALYKRDKRCTSCGIRASSCEVHHIVPWEHGGTTDISNLTLLCPTCHRQTHKHLPPHNQPLHE